MSTPKDKNQNTTQSKITTYQITRNGSPDWNLSLEINTNQDEESITINGIRHDLVMLALFLVEVSKLYNEFWARNKTPGMLQIPGLWKNLMTGYAHSLKDD